jgi:hypothetical protein
VSVEDITFFLATEFSSSCSQFDDTPALLPSFTLLKAKPQSQTNL